MSAIGAATLLFHHECKILRIFPIASLYFVLQANSPLTHLQATLLSPHICTVGPSPRVCTVMSSGPRSLGVFSKSLFSLSLFFGCLCAVGSFNVGDELVFVHRRALLLSRNHPIFLTRSTCGHPIPHISSIVPHPIYASILCDFLDLLSSFLCVGSATMLYISTYTPSSESKSPHSLFSSQTHTMARHMLSAIFSHKKGQAHLYPTSSWPYCTFSCDIRPTSLLFVFSVGIISSLFLCPSLQLFQWLLCP